MTARPAGAAALLALCAAVPALAEPNPEYSGWAKCKPGATTTVRVTTQDGITTTDTTVVSKLVELRADGAVVEITTSVTANGQTTAGKPVRRTVPKESSGPSLPPNLPKVPADAKAWDVTRGTDTRTVMGKDVVCQTTDVKLKPNPLGIKSETKTWSCDGIPGFVRVESSVSGLLGSDTTMDLVEFKDGR